MGAERRTPSPRVLGDEPGSRPKRTWLSAGYGWRGTIQKDPEKTLYATAHWLSPRAADPAAAPVAKMQGCRPEVGSRRREAPPDEPHMQRRPRLRQSTPAVEQEHVGALRSM
jgi:hypothetical protein